MEDSINDLQMPSEELKNIKERIAIVTAAINGPRSEFKTPVAA